MARYNLNLNKQAVLESLRAYAMTQPDPTDHFYPPGGLMQFGLDAIAAAGLPVPSGSYVVTAVFSALVSDGSIERYGPTQVKLLNLPNSALRQGVSLTELTAILRSDSLWTLVHGATHEQVADFCDALRRVLDQFQ